MTARLLIEYDGTGFRGWAKQPGLRTVQGELERALEIVRREPTRLTVAGRTDAGVHALGQVASHPGQPAKARSLNALLPPDIAVLASDEADERFDARGDATARRYRYRVWTHRERPALLRGKVLWYSYEVDRALLDACAELLIGEHDFEAFTLAEEPYVTHRRTISGALWQSAQAGSPGVSRMLEFWVEADSFTRRMVRSLVSFQLDVAAGRRELAEFERLLQGAPRSAGGGCAAPDGLYLAGVAYPGSPLPPIGERAL